MSGLSHYTYNRISIVLYFGHQYMIVSSIEGCENPITELNVDYTHNDDDLLPG